MRIGYCSDWMGQSTQKIVIIDETISGKYVCQFPPIEMTNVFGEPYLAQPLTGIFLRDKKDVKEVKNGNLSG